MGGIFIGLILENIMNFQPRKFWQGFFLAALLNFFSSLLAV